MRALLAAIAAVALLLAGCGGEAEKGPNAAPKDTKLKTAYAACDPTSDAVELGDGNHSLLIHGAGATAVVDGQDLTDTYKNAVESLADAMCILGKLNTPEYITQEIQETTAMMGRQHEEDGGLAYDWSFHPDNGLDITIHED